MNREDILNYNLSFLTFLDAISEFKGYITGIPVNSFETDIVNLTTGDFERSDNNAYFDQLQVTNDTDLEKMRNSVIPEIFDRTSGGYKSVDIVNKNHSLLKGISYPVNMGKYLHFIGADLNVAGVRGTNEFINTIPVLTPKEITQGAGDIDIPKGKFNINLALKKLDSFDLITGTEKDEVDTVFGITSKNPVYVFQDSINKNPQVGSKYESPHLNSWVFRDPSIAVLSKNANHLPIFFNAIPPIELSRCTPYIKLTMLTRKRKGKKFSHVKTFRFDNINNTDKPSSDYVPDGLTKEIETNYDFNYMDLFTSPQTMANADINKMNEEIFSRNNNDPVLEPISSLLTLNSFTVQISGKGYGLMSSKKATLSLTLHDRSRLSEISDLVASDRIGATKFLIEYGWNHPDGNHGSDNVIARYLNALKDISVMGVTSSSYNFKQGGVVSINLTLHAQAFRQSDRVHIGAGPVVPVNIIEDIIETAVNNLLSEESENKTKEEFADVRQKLKTTRSDATSIFSNVSWETYRKFANVLKEPGRGTDQLKTELKTAISNFLFNTATESKLNIGQTEYSNVFNSIKKQSIQASALSKLEYIKSDAFRDPYLLSYISSKKSVGEIDIESTNELTYENIYSNYVNEIFLKAGITDESIKASYGKFVTLGSVIATFFAYPIAAVCRFDEVQLVFNTINHSAAGAREFTLANFPIQVKALEQTIKEMLTTNVTLTVNNFLNRVINNIVSDRNNIAYGLVNQYKALSEISNKKLKDNNLILQTISESIFDGTLAQAGAGFDPINNTEDEILNELNFEIPNRGNDTFADLQRDINTLNGISDENFALVSEDADIFSKLQRKVITRCKELYDASFAANELKKASEAVNNSLLQIYVKDSISAHITGGNFILPEVSIIYETFPVIPGTKVNDELAVDTNLVGDFLNVLNRSINNSNNGIDYEKSLLRITIFDEESVIAPREFELATSKSENSVAFEKGDIPKRIEKLSRSQIKDLIKRKYPTINYGASSATINKISFQSTTSNAYANVLAVEGYADTLTGNINSTDVNSNFDSVQLFPGRLSLECAGMPMIGMGNQVYIDFSTNTTLDNVYTVNNVSHNINNGMFTTTVELLPSHQGSFKDFRDQLIKTAQNL
jgi:hypothetical protein